MQLFIVDLRPFRVLLTSVAAAPDVVVVDADIVVASFLAAAPDDVVVDADIAVAPDAVVAVAPVEADETGPAAVFVVLAAAVVPADSALSSPRSMEPMQRLCPPPCTKHCCAGDLGLRIR